MTKKMSTPTKPPGSQARSAWKMTTPSTASARNPLMSSLKVELRPGSRRDEVRRFEGFVQHVVLSRGRQSPTVRFDGVDRPTTIGKRPPIGQSAGKAHIAANAKEDV